MSTRSLIGSQDENGKIKAIYCHSDGYPDHLGATLIDHYNTQDKIDALIALGDLSALYENIAPLSEYAPPSYAYREPKDVKHSYNTPQKGVTKAYHRDRGEELRIHEYDNEEGFIKAQGQFWADYIYLWKNGKWHVDGHVLTAEIIKNGIPKPANT